MLKGGVIMDVTMPEQAGIAEEAVKGVGRVPMLFIRGPYIAPVSENVDVLAAVDGNIVAAQQANQLATAFHPKLAADLRIHRRFLELAPAYGRRRAP